MIRRPLVACFASLLVLLACVDVKKASLGDSRVPSAEPPENAGDEGGMPNQPADASDPDAALDGGPKDASSIPSCDGPCPPEVLGDVRQGTALTLDGTNIYFAEEGGNGRIQQCPKAGCAGAPIILGYGGTYRIAVLNGNVYWGEFSSGRVWRCSVGGCGETPTAIAVNQNAVHAVVTDGTKLYWSANESIMVCDPANCNPTTLRSNTGGILSMAADPSNIVYVDRGARQVFACATPTCSTPLLLGPGTSGVFVFAGTAFWVSGLSSTAVSCSTAGCAGEPRTLGSSFNPMTPVVDHTSLYFRDFLSRQVFRCPIAGCGATADVIASTQLPRGVEQMAVDATHVYWVNPSKVVRTPK